MIAPVLAALLLAAPQQSAPPQQVPPSAEAPVDLEDVVVEGRRLEDMTDQFVREVAAPARNRGLARWRGGVCVGVANLEAEAAQYIADRVSTVARDLGLRVGEPGCRPSILIVATIDSNAFTRDFVARRPRLFRVGGSGMDAGSAAFDAFLTSDRPVRWWTVSAPVDDDTGGLAVRIPGFVNGDADPGGDGNVLRFAPQTSTRVASRLTAQVVDDAKRSFVIIDVDRIGQVSAQQLADYVAMVSLAQIDPQADTSGYATILNLFDDPTRTEGLTNWDRAYLAGLYDTVRTRQNPGAHRTEIAASIIRAHHDITAEPEADPAP